MSNETSAAAKTHSIVVNAKPKQFEGPLITYEEAVKLAFPDGPFDVIYTVQYVNPRGHDGTLAPGQKAPLHDGMEFVVRKTNRS
jgi:hypothetical protein